MSQVGAKVKRGAMYSGVALGGVQIISLVQTVLLARLLSPAELGLYAAGTVLTGFLVSVSEGGLRGALIQREDDVEDAADTVFWATAATGVLLAVGAFAASPLIGTFFNDSSAASAIAAMSSGTLLLHALTNVPDGLMQRQLNFKRRLIIDPVRVVAYAVVAVTMAAMGYGVWALVVAQYVGMLVWVVGTWWLARWRPGIGRPSYKLWRELARFAFPLMAEGLVEKVRTTAETALVGRSLGEHVLGQYRQSERLSQIPTLVVVQIGSFVLFPALARLANDPPRMQRAFMRALQWTWIFSVPVAGLIVALGQPAVVLVLGEKWSAAGLAMVAMSGYGLGISLQAAGSEVIKATGRSQLLNWTTGISLVLGIGLLVAMLPFGLVGVGLAISATEMVLGVVILVLVHRVSPFPVLRMVWMLVPPAVVAVVVTLAVRWLDRAVVHADSHGTAFGLVLLVAEVVLFFILFIGGLALVAPSLVKGAVAAVTAKLRKRKGAVDDDEDEDEDEENIVARDRPMFDFDSPTMLMPMLSVDDTMEFRVRSAAPRPPVRSEPPRPFRPAPPRGPRRPPPPLPPPSHPSTQSPTQKIPAQQPSVPLNSPLVTQKLPQQRPPDQPRPDRPRRAAPTQRDPQPAPRRPQPGAAPHPGRPGPQPAGGQPQSRPPAPQPPPTQQPQRGQQPSAPHPLPQPAPRRDGPAGPQPQREPRPNPRPEPHRGAPRDQPTRAQPVPRRGAPAPQRGQQPSPRPEQPPREPRRDAPQQGEPPPSRPPVPPEGRTPQQPSPQQPSPQRPPGREQEPLPPQVQPRPLPQPPSRPRS